MTAEHVGLRDAGWGDRSPPDRRAVLGYLAAIGLAVPSDLTDQRVEVDDWSRSHAVVSVRFGDGRQLVVKRARPRPGERYGTIDHELDAHEQYSQEPAWVALSPRCLWIDRRRQILITAAVRPGTTFHARTRTQPVRVDEFAHLGTVLGTWHRGSRTKPSWLGDGTPWILDVLRPGYWRPPVTDRLLAHGTVRRTLRTAFADLAAGHTSSCVVHGDLKWDHCLTAGRLGVHVVDWETMSFGDPAWDVAGILHDHLALVVTDPHRAPWVAATASAFVAAYVDAGGAGRQRDFTVYANALAGARLVQTALETADADEQLARRLLAGALDALRDPRDQLWTTPTS